MLRRWLVSSDPRAMHVLMCPFAGASSNAFRDWQQLGDAGIDVSLAVYPGRDQRMQEPCASDIGALADMLVAALSAYTPAARQPLVLVGHSMGAQVAFEACLRLERCGTPPRALILSACHAPHLRARRLLSGLDDQDFLQQLQHIGGTHSELLRDSTLMAAFLPMLRADFGATEAYQRACTSDRTRLRTPTLLLCGSTDKEALPAEVSAWQEWLNDTVTPVPVQISGDHFYVTRYPRAVITQILQHFHFG